MIREFPKTTNGDVIIRERKGKYYVYKLETINGEVKETYVGPLADVVETYEKLKDSSGGVRVSPTTWARWDLNPGPPPCQGDVLTRLDDGPLILGYCFLF
ncbi:Integrase, probable(amino-end fragment) [Saccharolobus solfataricus P2]|uniref:Integrase, probable(Amino-end) n=2 Tax=Saccharolobus solfataricus TaxID=2287 RepID=Q980M8_SACS2|nr:Integrase, probable(amino-end fragment) [Saccharolobus solfataricus P2]SAI83802.1 SSV1-like integrase, N-terminal fragment [Saccharolobus solfataricus]